MILLTIINNIIICSTKVGLVSSGMMFMPSFMEIRRVFFIKKDAHRRDNTTSLSFDIEKKASDTSRYVFFQLVASDLSGTVLDQVLDTCSKRVLEVHGDTLTKLYPVTRPHDLLPLIKVKKNN